MRASTDSGDSVSHHFGLNVALATPREKLSSVDSRSRSPGGLDASGTPAREKAPASPPPGGGGGTSGGGGGTSGSSGGGGSVLVLCEGGSSESSSSFFSSWLVLFSCSLLVLRDMMMNKKNFSWLIS